MFELPLFPLHTVLFPGAPLRLHIFEERYKLMMQRVLESERPFGVVLIRQGDEAYSNLAEPYLIGCTSRIQQVEPLSDGRMNLVTRGDQVFRILRISSEKPYLVALVETVQYLDAASGEAHYRTDLVREMMITYLQLLLKAGLREVNVSGFQPPEDPLSTAYLAASILMIPPHEKQSLLEASSMSSLAKQLVRVYRREISILPKLYPTSDEASRRAAWLN